MIYGEEGNQSWSSPQVSSASIPLRRVNCELLLKFETACIKWQGGILPCAGA